ncbi:Dihydroflavonol 4-reductase [Linum perenne]
MESVEEGQRNGRRYCVTGANGYIGSYLVKHLLQWGASVNATLRNPSEQPAAGGSSNSSNQLKLFKSDLEQSGSFDEAVKGCHGVFHVAAPMQFHGDDENKAISTAIEGTLNLLRSCSKSSTSVKRVVFTSSISTLTAKNPDGSWKRVVDETCRVDAESTRENRASGWIYVLSKLLSEEAAFEYGFGNGIDIISVVTPTVAGPFLNSSVPASIQVLMSPITGDRSFSSILSAVSNRMGSIGLVHIDDICRAHLFLMENSKAEGKYLCCTNSCLLSELVHLLTGTGHHHSSSSCAVPSEFSSRKLRELGFEFEHDIRCIVRDAIDCCVEKGFLKVDIDDQKLVPK